MLILFSTHSLMHWLHGLGGVGLILLAQVDNSPIPVPGSMDVLTIILASARKDLWWYYALMATIGAVSAGYIAYRLGAKGGKETLEKRLGEKHAKKVYSIFERYGFLSVLLAALAPPPVPTSAFLIAAGAMQYPKKKFVGALAIGRGVRYTLLAYLGSLYGHSIIRWMHRYSKPMMILVIVLSVAGGLFAIYSWLRHRREKTKTKKQRPAQAAA
jgi:membrane protein YqaA with SNARE-associated domain